MRNPKTVTFFSAFVALKENPEMRRIIEDKKGWEEAMTDDVKLKYSTDCEDASNLIYEHWLEKIHFMKSRNLVLHKFVYYYSGSEAAILR